MPGHTKPSMLGLPWQAATHSKCGIAADPVTNASPVPDSRRSIDTASRWPAATQSQAAGLIERPGEDVDLFTAAWDRRARPQRRFRDSARFLILCADDMHVTRSPDKRRSRARALSLRADGRAVR